MSKATEYLESKAYSSNLNNDKVVTLEHAKVSLEIHDQELALRMMKSNPRIFNNDDIERKESELETLMKS